MTKEKMTPQTPEEQGISIGIMRAALWTLVAQRKNEAITITEAQRDKLSLSGHPSLLRITLYPDMTIRMWLEESDQKLKRGVFYGTRP